MKKETYKIPKLDLNLEVFKNDQGRVQKTKIRRAKTTDSNKKINIVKIDVAKIEGLTDFQKKVYKTLMKVPAGKVLTYKELAVKMGSPKAARAIGSAMRRNPVPYLVPCHRVVRGDGVIGQFSAEGGASTKALLLASEGIKLNQNKRII